MKRRSSVLATLAVGGGVLAFTPAASAVTGVLLRAPQQASSAASAKPMPIRLPPDRHGVLAPVPVGQRIAAPQGPRLDRSQQAVAGQLLAASPEVHLLAGSRGYRVTSVVPWTAPGSDVVSGAFLTVRLTRTFSGDVTLPGVRYDAQGAGYTVLRLHQHVGAVAGLSVLVSFDRSAVVGIQPDDAARVTGLSGNTLTAARGN